MFRETGTEDQGLTLFTRIGGAPADINPVDFYVDGGAAYTGLFDGRDADVTGFAVGFSNVSSSLQGLDEDARMFSGMNTPVEDYEIVFEFVYSAQIAPWWLVQPDFQYIVHPGGNVADPNDPTGLSTEPDAVVLGIRSTFTF